MTWCQLGWRYDSLQISWQVHHHWLQGLSGRIEDMDALHRTVATIDIIKLDFLGIRFQTAQHGGIITREVSHLLHYLALHGQHKRRPCGIAIQEQLLIECTHLLGIVGHLDHKFLAWGNTPGRIFHGGATTTFLHLFD